jgi:transposase InsO family protein
MNKHLLQPRRTPTMSVGFSRRLTFGAQYVRRHRFNSSIAHHNRRTRTIEPAQYLSIAYAERLAEAGLVGSVGSKGDSYDNAAAEALNALFKAEVIRRLGPWKGLDDVELAVCEWVDGSTRQGCIPTAG